MEVITHLVCDGYITTIHLYNKKPIVISKILKHFESELNEFGFIRANNNTIVNLKYLEKIDLSSKQRVLHVNQQ